MYTGGCVPRADNSPTKTQTANTLRILWILYYCYPRREGVASENDVDDPGKTPPVPNGMEIETAERI